MLKEKFFLESNFIFQKFYQINKLTNMDIKQKFLQANKQTSH